MPDTGPSILYFMYFSQKPSKVGAIIVVFCRSENVSGSFRVENNILSNHGVYIYIYKMLLHLSHSKIICLRISVLH